MSIEASTLISVLENRPARAISALLDDRPQTIEDDLPEQLALFSAFYDDGQKK